MPINLTPNQSNLTDEERSTLWSRVRSSITGSRIATNQIIKPKYMNFLSSPIRKGALILLAVTILAGTAGAADAAKPGDILFNLDLSLERMRLTFADADTKMDLRIKFAEERVDELEEILAEDAADAATAEDVAPDTTGDTSDGATDSGTQNVAPNMTNADIALAQSIEHLELAKLAIEENGGSEIALAALNAVIEKLNSRIGKLPEGAELKVIVENNQDETEIRIRLKRSEEHDDEGDSDEHEIKIDNETRIGLNDDEKIEVHSKGDVSRVEVEIGNMHDKFQLSTISRSEIITQIAKRLNMSEGSVEEILKIEIENTDGDKDADSSHDDEADDSDDSADGDSDDADDNDSDKDDEADDSDDNDSADGDSDDRGLRIEAKIEDNGIAEIKVHINDTEDEFKAPANTRNDVIDMLLARYDLTEDEISAALDLELKD